MVVVEWGGGGGGVWGWSITPFFFFFHLVCVACKLFFSGRSGRQYKDKVTNKVI